MEPAPWGNRGRHRCWRAHRCGESKADAELDASELAAYTLVANLILNLDETLNKN